MAFATDHPKPWSLKYTKFGESMGYDSKTVIVDANGHHVATLGSGAAETRSLEEITALEIVNSVNARVPA